MLERGVIALQVIARALQPTQAQGLESTIIDFQMAAAGLTRVGKSIDRQAAVANIGGERLYSPEEAAKFASISMFRPCGSTCEIGGLGGNCDQSGRWWIRQSEIEAFLTAKRRINGT